MGRTIPSFRIAEEQEAAMWRPFRKTLLRRDRAAFDEMLSSARLYTSASSAAVRPSKFEGMAMAIIFHHYTMLARSIEAVSEIGRGEAGR
ncbi:MAG: hypothetical protein JRN24_03995 [Nitrososphaerota archaeon]|nr:hypothetical protein [Nitrososphaerota archaeon]